jgi:hypothetical protein
VKIKNIPIKMEEENENHFEETGLRSVGLFPEWRGPRRKKIGKTLWRIFVTESNS